MAGRTRSGFSVDSLITSCFSRLAEGSQSGPNPDFEEAHTMAADDKADHKAEELKGKAKETVGKATDDEELEAQGKGDQAKSDVKQAGEKLKDAFKK